MSDLTVCVAVFGSSLWLTYRLQAEFAGLCIPSPRGNTRADGLWNHSCFEVFIRGATDPGYLEFNFSPSGEWATYRFDDYRKNGVPFDPMSSPGIQVSQKPGLLELAAVISMSDLQVLSGQLKLGLSAIVETSDGGFSYWALKHPADKPDFHHPESFALSLPMDGVRQN